MPRIKFIEIIRHDFLMTYLPGGGFEYLGIQGLCYPGVRHFLSHNEAINYFVRL